MDTQRYISKISGAKLIVLEQQNIRIFDLDARPEWSIGRVLPDGSNAPDVPFSSMIVSRKHGWLKHIDETWYYVDNPENLNGTFLNGSKIERPVSGTRVPRTLSNGDVLRIDNSDLNHVCKDGVLMLFSTQPVGEQWTVFPLSGRGSTTIGRDADCDISEPLPYLSAKHAEITCVNGQYYLSDCGSKAGTFLNGTAVSKKQLLR